MIHTHMYALHVKLAGKGKKKIPGYKRPPVRACEFVSEGMILPSLSSSMPVTDSFVSVG